MKKLLALVLFIFAFSALSYSQPLGQSSFAKFVTALPSPNTCTQTDKKQALLFVRNVGLYKCVNGTYVTAEGAGSGGGGTGNAQTASPLSQFANTTSAQLLGIITNPTGTDSLVFANAPTLTTPRIAAILNGASTITVPSTTGTLALTSQITGTNSGVNTGDQIISDVTISTTNTTANNVSTSKHGFVPILPGNTTTFFRGDGTYATITGGGNALTSGSLGQFSTTTSAELATVLSNETGIGSAVFSISPTLTTPNIASILNGAATVTVPTATGTLALTSNITDANLLVADTTNNNVSTSAHGFAPKLPGNTTTFLRGDGTYAAAGGGGGTGTGITGYTPTNITTSRSIDASNPTTASLANTLGTLIQDLQTVGVSSAITPIGVALSDEATAVTPGLKTTIRLPLGFTLTSVKAHATTAGTVNPTIIDIQEAGVSIFTTTKLRIDATEETSATASVAYNLTDLSLADDAKITFIVDSPAPTGLTGLKVWLIGRYTTAGESGEGGGGSIGGGGGALMLDSLTAYQALSIRKVRTAYTGFCMCVRSTESSGACTDVGFAVDGFVDEAALAAVGSSLEVVTWYDQSGNARNGTGVDGSDGNMPTIQLNTISGQASIHYDLNSHFTLENLSALTVAEAARVTKIPAKTGGDSNAVIAAYWTHGFNDFYSYPDSNGLYMGFGADTRKPAIFPTQNLTVWHTYQTYSAPNAWRDFINNSALRAEITTNTVYFPNLVAALGRSTTGQYMVGNEAEFILFNTQLSTANRTAVYTSQAASFGF